MTQTGDLPKIGTPATRALQSIGITELKHLTKVTEADVLQLHGFGPRALGILRETLEVQGPSFKTDAVGVSSRSNPATYTGIMDDIRKAFASFARPNAALFSFNSKGAWENCQGLSVIYTDLAFLNEARTPCEVCGGKRFKDEVLVYKLTGTAVVRRGRDGVNLS